MKKLISLLIICSLVGSAWGQGIKISQLPTLPSVSNIDSSFFAIIYRGTTYKMPGYYLKGYATDDSLAFINLVQLDSFHILVCNRRSICDTLVGIMGGSGGTPIDTAAKWLTRIYRKTASDSVFAIIGGASVFQYRDSLGSGGGGGGSDSAIWKNNGTYTGNRNLSMAGYSQSFSAGRVSIDSLVSGGGLSKEGAGVTLRNMPTKIAFPTIQGDTATTFKYGNYYISQDESYVNSNGRRDAVWQVGYNSKGGSKVVAGEGALRVAMESEYQASPGARPQFEFHIAFTANDSAYETRVLSFTADKVNNGVSLFTSADQITMFGSSGANATKQYAAFSNGATGFYHNGNGMFLTRNGNNANYYSITDGDGGPVIDWASIAPSVTRLGFSKPISVAASTTYGTFGIPSAIQASLNAANQSGVYVDATTLGSSNGYAYRTIATTTGTFTALNATNSGAGKINASLGGVSGCEASYDLVDYAAGSTWKMYNKAGDPNKSLYWKSSTGVDSVLAFSGLNGLVKVKYGLALGLAYPVASAMLDVQSTTQGVLLPRMTKAQRDAIPSPAIGLEIFQTDNTPGKRCYNGTNWMKYTEATD